MVRVAVFQPGGIRPDKKTANANLFKLSLVLPVKFMEFLVVDGDALLKAHEGCISQNALTVYLEGIRHVGLLFEFLLGSLRQENLHADQVLGQRVDEFLDIGGGHLLVAHGEHDAIAG